MKPCIITICGDPGGAIALASVIKKIEKQNKVKFIHFTYNQANQIFRHREIESICLSNEINHHWIKSILQESGSLLLTATSHNAFNFEKLFIYEAQKLNLCSITLLDFWSNYRLRFEDNNGDLKYLPNFIAVMDQMAKNAMIKLGFSEKKIIVTGQPAFDNLSYYLKNIPVNKKNEIRRSLNIDDNEFLVTFLSQPLKEVFGEPDSPHYLGFDETIVLTEVIKSLEVIQKNNKRIILLIRPHPRENIQLFRNLNSSSIRIISNQEGDGKDIMLASDLIIGMNTALLIDACYLSCKVLSIQPGLLKEDNLPTNIWGASKAVYDKNAILTNIENMLFNKIENYSPLSKCPPLDGKASEKLMKIIYNLLKINLDLE